MRASTIAVVSAIAIGVALVAAPTSRACDVTRPTSPGARYGTYGNAYLGTNPDPEGVLKGLPVRTDPSTELRVSLAWWRWRTGQLSVTGRRLDAPAAPLRAELRSDPTQAGFQDSDLYVPSAGCWEIVGHLNEGELRIVTWIAPVAARDRPGTSGVQPTAGRRALTKAQELSRYWGSRPKRADSPLRAQNISDDEVREIQSVLGVGGHPELLNIAGVVTGCPCEDGPACREQVWVVNSAGGRMQGLMLSRIDAHWTIGPLQRWWIQRDDLDRRLRGSGNWNAWESATLALNAKYPACEAALPR